MDAKTPETSSPIDSPPVSPNQSVVPPRISIRKQIRSSSSTTSTLPTTAPVRTEEVRKSLVSSEYDEDNNEEQEANGGDEKMPCAQASGLKRKRRDNRVFYYRKCESHRHRTSRETIRACQERRGGCRLSMFTRSSEGASEVEIEEDSGQPIYAPRLAKLYRAFRSAYPRGE